MFLISGIAGLVLTFWAADAGLLVVADFGGAGGSAGISCWRSRCRAR